MIKSCISWLYQKRCPLLLETGKTSWKLKLILLLFFFTAGQSVIAQEGRVRGKLQDEKGKPVSFANVALLKAGDSSLAATVISDSAGLFSLSVPVPARYRLQITAIGFSELRTDAFEMPASGNEKLFNQLTLTTDAKALKDVTITALRPTITQLADRMVVNVQGTAMAAGNTAYAVLSRAPGVFIDAEGNIQLNGRSGVLVMIDGKQTYLSARDLRTLLEGMSAENLKNIEIITNPSAKYDAEGTAGILNINLKKNTQQGMNGSMYASYNYNFRQQHGATAGGNINYKSGRWNSFANIDFVRRVGGREATFTRIFYGNNKTTYFDQVATEDFMVQGPPSVRLGTDYSFNDQHSVGAMVNFTTNTADAAFLTNTYIGSVPKNPSQNIEAENFSANTYTNYTTNLHYTGKLDTLGTQLSTDLDYVKLTNRGAAYFNNYFSDMTTGAKTSDLLYNHTPNGYDIYSARLDFTLPLTKKHKLEMGGRASRITTDNDFRFYFNNGSRVLDPQRTNHFRYDEKIYAAYVNWSGTVSEKVTVQSGLRMENTASRGNSLTTGQVTPRNYTDFFPSVFLQQKVNDNYGVSYSYSRRLTRPRYGSLNPFRAYRDPYTWYEGNTGLRPQYTHSFGIAQTFKKIYNLSLSYQRNRDVMAEIPILLVDDTTTIYTTGNVDNGYSIGMTGVAPLKITKWWDTQNTTVLSYSKFSMQSNNGQLLNDQVFFMLQSNHTIQLPKAIRVELNLLYRGPAASGLYHMASMHRVDIAFRRSFWNKKLDLTLNANDLFKGFRYFWTTDINGNVNEFDQYFRFRTIGATLRYNFSRGQKVDTKRRNNTVEELNRT
ncbi:MAG: TonB-dependent receptor family protein [Bacteroidota bacterium]|nr:TonB-dependent receptor family protein [Bacteroidota bacterium]